MGHNRKRNTGLPPGSAIYNGKYTDGEVLVDYLEYDDQTIKDEKGRQGNEIVLHISDNNVVQWYDIRGLHDEELIKSIADRFGMHPLAIEDAVDVHQRPNYTEYQNGHFISIKSIGYDRVAKKVTTQAIGIYFGDGYVLSFQEKPDEIFDEVRNRITKSKGRIRSRKADYLAYALVDYIVDKYYQTLDIIEEEVEALEESISNATDDMDKGKIYSLKKEILKIRKSVSPLREAINMFSRSDSPLIEERTSTFIRDVYDHTIQVIDTTDNLRDILSGLQDLYLSEISMKMNKIMQFLTIVTALFVPLSFLTGLYGMNFEYIPELKIKNGYFILWAFMIICVLGMLYYFRRKKWL